MSTPSDQLPHYTDPPVIEVVLGVQFEELQGFLSVHLGSFWESVKNDYPQTEDKPPLPTLLEEGSITVPSLEFLDLPPLRRVFMIHSSKNYLLQLQPSRFLYNWRKLKPTDAYPRFTAAEEGFQTTWTGFRRFLEQNRIGSLKVNQYELTYINHIPVDEDSGFFQTIQDFTNIFKWPSKRPDLFLPDPTSLSTDVKFRLPENRGMLHVNVKHGRRVPDKREVVLLELTARGPAKNDASDLNTWFSVAHETIVRGFTDMTTQVAHQRWGRTK